MYYRIPSWHCDKCNFCVSTRQDDGVISGEGYAEANVVSSNTTATRDLAVTPRGHPSIQRAIKHGGPHRIPENWRSMWYRYCMKGADGIIGFILVCRYLAENDRAKLYYMYSNNRNWLSRLSGVYLDRINLCLWFLSPIITPWKGDPRTCNIVHKSLHAPRASDAYGYTRTPDTLVGGIDQEQRKMGKIVPYT